MALSPAIRVSQAGVIAVSAYPADGVRASQAGMVVPVDAHGDVVRASQVGVIVVAVGRVASPRVRAWTYTLDEHTHYVLRLGTQATLELDTKTGMWAVWGSDDEPVWRAYTGINWPGAGEQRALGSNVVVGDDGNGSLYILDPNGEADDDAMVGSETPRPFTRKVSGQVAFRGRGRQPCAGVELLGSVGQQTSADLTAVTLYVSDDRGANYRSMGTIEVAPGETGKRLDWRQLGSMTAPGRLFRIEDDGALKRIDSLSMKP
jgi:hypothetical protein